nr:PREDICTED: rho guanine nucleotide exchange factor 11 isoform X3 [Bemisia tabaci]
MHGVRKRKYKGLQKKKLARLFVFKCLFATNPLVQTHHRTKSSPDQISNLLGNLSLSEASKRLIASESISDLSLGTKRAKSGVVCDVDSPRITPPGTPPPPYPIPVTALPESTADPVSPLQQDDPDSSRGEPPPTDSGQLEASPVKTNHGAFVTQQPIISMEDDEMSDQEMNQLEDHGPFKSLSKLWEHNAHLAVFMNYVISNSDPSSLLFYLVTDLYKEGNAKEMKKWAYEIHSSFLVPGAPLRLNNVDENVAREIDEVLLNESDREEILRKIFWKARVKAKEELNEQLADFQQTRTAGLGTLFGPTDAQLDETIHDKNKEQKIIEQILIPKMEPFIEDMEREVVDDRRFTMAAALGTIMGKVFGVRGQHFSSLLDRCPTFVSKEKSLKARLIGRSRKVTVRGHNFVAHQYYTVTYCNHCQLIIWGIGPQGYQCTNCNLNIHRPCVKTLEENCPGPLERKKEKGNDRISKLMEKIRPERETRRKPSSLIIAQLEKMKRQTDEKENDCVPGDNDTGERPTVGGSKERRGLVDLVKEAEERGNAAVNDDDSNHLDVTPHHATKSKSSATSINRSESYKERFHQKRQLRERRKTSDPNLSKTNSDVDVDHHGLTYHTNSGSSSNSSLSTRSLESPSNSLETVTGGGVKSDSVNNSTSAPQWDSDAEAEPDPPDWTKNVPEDVLRSLSPREKKRQEVINELFHTERSHVRGLKVLDQIFYQPMKEAAVLPQDQIQLLFSNLEEMLVYHSGFNNCMKAKRRETPVVGDIGDLLLDMFDGAEGENFQKAAAVFCSRQQIALEALKERRRKDPKLNSFLTDAEGNPMCRRLQLKDIIPTGMLRLTKYPLLFENLAKYTRMERSEEEMRMVLRALERSKEILNYVNQAVREAEDQHRLADIQRKLDKTSFDKADHPMVAEFKSLDLTKHRLIHEGVLNWRIGGNRQKVIELHVVLLEDMIILLQRQDEKFVLKFHNTNSGGYLSPVIKVSHVLVRHNAVDKKALYLVNTSHNNAQIYDLVASSSSERKTWFKHISDAAIAYQNRDGKNRRPELSAPPLQDLDAASQEKTKENDSAVSSNNNDLLSVPATGTSSVSNSNENETSPTSPSFEVDSHHPDNASRKLGSSVADPLRLTEEQNELIHPNQVIISQRSVQTAEPILTPLEKLRRQDDMIRQALAEKQKLVADILHVPHDQFETFAEMASEPAMDKEAAELILAAVNQANQLSAAVSSALSVTEEDAVTAHSKSAKFPSVSTTQLQTIATSLNNHLSQLLNIMTERDEEREKLRREVQRSREQLHAMHELRQKFQNSQGDDSFGDSTLNSQLLDSSALNESPADIDTSSGVEDNPEASAKLNQGNKTKSCEKLDDTT